HMTIPATFMWPRDAWDTPVTITFDRPDDDWHIATQLMPTDDPEMFEAPSLYYFMDSPTEISPFTMRSWEVMSNGETQTIRLAVHHAGTEAEVDAYAEMAKKVVAEQIAIFGEIPDYDGGTYTFIADYLPHVNGDGMEHRNSTILSSTGSLEENALGLLGTLSHEYFHQWNVERLRPQTLEPFDFEAANMSDALWFAEGFTSYYDDLTIRRAGITTDDDYAQSLTNNLNYVLTSPGSHFFSPVEMSQQAPFVDAASSIDPQNKSNTFISYYSWGAMIGLGLDLALRGHFGTTLDLYMRNVWQQYGKPEIPYTLADLQRILAEESGSPEFAEDFFQDHVYGRTMMAYKSLLSQAGFLLRLAHPDETWLGGGVTDLDGQVVIASNATIGGPLYEAGLDRGDVILEAEGQAIADVTAFMDMLDEYEPDDTLTLLVNQRGEQKQVVVTLAQDPQLEVVTYETAGRTLTDAQRTFRTKWLASRVH
ncbi:MAG TPA: PDZ domain-containing protein, partial [Rhodothermales bacterium]|nr:PDZ domain-containing protein [Rhodothermales bacterium]